MGSFYYAQRNFSFAVVLGIVDKFYGDRSGYLKDPFGHLWSIATHKKDLSLDEIKKAGKEAFAEMSKKIKESK